MKKFKNGLVIFGTSSLRKAFEEELLKLGYTNRKKECKVDTCKLILVNENRDKSSFVKNGEFASQDSYVGGRDEYTLPGDWDLALKLASEVEEEVPEYVELLSGWSVENEFIGEIFQLATLNNLHKFKLAPKKEEFVQNIQKWIQRGHFKPSTKAAYDQQQQELADKELLERLIKESGFKIGDKVTWGTKYDIVEIEDFNLIKNVRLDTTKFSPGNSQLAIYLGDKYKWYSASTDTLEVIGTSKTLTLGSSNIEIKISKGKIEAAGKEVRYGCITNLVSNMKLQDLSFSHTDWKVSFPSVKIGCSTFTLSELEQIVETYNELNK